MITPSSCHGPGCTKTADGDFCSERCGTVWHRQFADTTEPVAKILLEWRHPVRGRIAENVCEGHATMVRQALRTLGIGCAGQSFDAQVCVRCEHDGQDVRSWIRECVDDAGPVELPCGVDPNSPVPPLPPAVGYDTTVRVSLGSTYVEQTVSSEAEGVEVALAAVEAGQVEPPLAEPTHPEFATGGLISPSPDASDRVPALLSEGGCLRFWRGDHSGNHPLDAAFPQVASENPQVECGEPGWLGRAFERLFGKEAA